MIGSLLLSIGMIGIAAGLFGLYLACLLRGDGSLENAAAARHNAHLLLAASGAMLLVALAATG